MNHGKFCQEVCLQRKRKRLVVMAGIFQWSSKGPGFESQLKKSKGSLPTKSTLNHEDVFQHNTHPAVRKIVWSWGLLWNTRLVWICSIFIKDYYSHSFIFYYILLFPSMALALAKFLSNKLVCFHDFENFTLKKLSTFDPG